MAAPTFEALIKKGTSVSDDQLKTVLRSVHTKGRSLDDILSQAHFNTPEDAMAELCKHLGVDFIKDIPVNDIPIDIVQGIPINYAKNNEILPYKQDQEKVIVLITNPLNQKVLDDLRVK